MTKLEEIDTWREEAARLAKESNACPPAERGDYRSTLEAVEAKIDKLLVEYIALPKCPFCATGRFDKPPTSGILRCTRCLSLAVIGTQIKHVHVAGHSFDEIKLG